MDDTLNQLTAKAFAIAARRGYRKSPPQMDYARRVATAIERGVAGGHGNNGLGGSVLLLEAETGTGKTLGYLLPLLLRAAVSRERVAVATYTLHLQKQIVEPGGDMESALSIVEAVTGVRLTCARRVGVRNFVSLAAISRLFKDYEEKLGEGCDECLALEEMLVWMENDGSGIFQDFLDEHGYAEDAFPVPQEMLCLHAASPEGERLLFKQHCAQADGADVVLITHAMLALHAMRGYKVLDTLGRKIKHLIVDEADRFEDAAALVSSFLVPLRESGALLKHVEERVRNNGALKHLKAALLAHRRLVELVEWEAAQAKVENLNEQVFIYLDEVQSADGIVQCARALGDSLRAVAEILHDQPELAADLAGLSFDLDKFCDDRPSAVRGLRWSPTRKYPSLSLVETNPARVLRHAWHGFTYPGDDGEVEVQARLTTVVFTSATLSAPQREGFSHEQFVIAHGIYKDAAEVNADLHHSFEAEDFGLPSFVLSRPDMALPTLRNETDDDDDDEPAAEYISSPEWLDHAADMAREAYCAGTGRTLVLTTSYSDADALAERLRDLGSDVLLHRRGSKMGAYIHAFRANPGVIWITPAAWEGVNIVDDSGRCLIANLVVTRIPFEPPKSVAIEVERRCMVAKGMRENTVRTIQANRSRGKAAKKLRQAFGRGIRHFQDTPCIWIADPRFRAPSAMIEQCRRVGIYPNGKAAHVAAIVHAIPRRFRASRWSAYETAVIFPEITGG